MHLNNHGIIIESAYGEKKLNNVEKNRLINICSNKYTFLRHISNWSDTDLNKLIFQNEEKLCSICLEDANCINNWMCYICGALFHKTCYKKWIINNPSCPLCRSKKNSNIVKS